MQPPLAGWRYRGLDVELAAAFVYGEKGERIEIRALVVAVADNPLKH